MRTNVTATFTSFIPYLFTFESQYIRVFVFLAASFSEIVDILSLFINMW